MRCFIGVPLPDKIVKVLFKAEDSFRNVDARMSIVSPECMHVTLCFIGAVDDVSKIDELLSSVKLVPFKASVKGLSYFSDDGYIRVIHAPIIDGRKEFVSLYESIANALSLKLERFIPHITLARVKFVKSTNALSRACNSVSFNEVFNVESFNLYSSMLTPKGPVYEVIGSYPKK